MRILFPFVGTTIGGSHISSLTLIKALRTQSVEPFIVVHEPQPYLDWASAQGEQVTLVKLPYLRAGEHHLLSRVKLFTGFGSARRLLRGLGIDLVHGNDNRMNHTWVHWARKAAVPFVWHQRNKWKQSPRAHETLNMASGVISISNFVAQQAPPLTVPHATIYNPIRSEARDRTECARLLRSELGVSASTRIVACFANAQQWKRPDTFVHAGFSCTRQTDTTVFVWFGNDYDGSLARAMAAAQQADGPARIYHLPFRQDVLTAMAGCDVIVSASENEPFGRTVVEAMSVGTPVVISDGGGHRELVQDGENGLLFPIGDADACSRAVLSLLQDKTTWHRLSQRGLERARDFSPQQHARSVVAFYEQLLNRNRVPPK